jgi:hypothetical protein
MSDEEPKNATKHLDSNDVEAGGADAGELSGGPNVTNGEGGSDSSTRGQEGPHPSFSGHLQDQQHFQQQGPLRGSTQVQSTDSAPSPNDHPQNRSSIAANEGFVQPSSYLRRARGYSRTMVQQKPPDTPVDIEQRHALVGLGFTS